MKIYDCFLYNDENEILEIRLNTLNNFVDKFIIVESKVNHQGKLKKINFNLDKFLKFKDKILYFLIDEYKGEYTYWEIENYQRNYILKGLKNCQDDDVIIISDLDEIPNLEKFDFDNMQKKIYVFEQDFFMYKLNLERKKKWHGTKLCKFKDLKSLQWLRSLKTKKKYPFWRIDKIFDNNYNKNFEVVKNGGWHFSWLKSVENIILKLDSYVHKEFNNELFNTKKYILNCIKNKINFLDPQEKLEVKNINFSFPKYVLNNKNLFSEWIEKV